MAESGSVKYLTVGHIFCGRHDLAVFRFKRTMATQYLANWSIWRRHSVKFQGFTMCQRVYIRFGQVFALKVGVMCSGVTFK